MPDAQRVVEGRDALPASRSNGKLDITINGENNMSKPPFVMSKYARREDLLSDAVTFYEADAVKGRALLSEWLYAYSNFDFENFVLRVRNYVEDEGEKNDA